MPTSALRLALPTLSVAEELRSRVRGFGASAAATTNRAASGDFALRESGRETPAARQIASGAPQAAPVVPDRATAAAGKIKITQPEIDRETKVADPIPPVAPQIELAETQAETADEADRAVDAVAAARGLIAASATRAIFLSPEGNEAAAGAIRVAREIADAGYKVLLLDLTSSGAESMAMLDTRDYSGITNLLLGESEFADVIHGDLYSDCHIIPTGTADPALAMLSGHCLPLILDALNQMYHMVVIECGPAPVSAIGMLAGNQTQIVVSVLEPGDVRVAETENALREMGYEGLIKVSPAG